MIAPGSSPYNRSCCADLRQITFFIDEYYFFPLGNLSEARPAPISKYMYSNSLRLLSEGKCSWICTQKHDINDEHPLGCQGVISEGGKLQILFMTTVPVFF